MDTQTVVLGTTSGTMSIEGCSLELTFAETEDSGLFDRLRHTLFQLYIQSLATPIDRKI